jgi:hypothetical protein
MRIILKLPPLPHMFLALALRTDLKLDYLTGRAVALTSSNELALVPASSREGDLIILLLRESAVISKRQYKPFVFHPLETFAKEDKGLKVDHEKNNTTRPMPKNHSPSEVLCEFVGESFCAQFPKVEPNDTFILVLK